MSIFSIPDFAQRSIALLAGQFQDAPITGPTNMQKLVTAAVVDAQEIQTQLVNLNTQRWLDTSQGVQLDGLGQILGLARLPGQPDDTTNGVTGYRQALQFQVFINLSSGTPEETIQAVAFFTLASTVWYFDVQPAAYQLITNGTNFPANPNELINAILSLSPAGVDFLGLECTYDTVPLVFAEDDDPVPFFVAPDPDDISQTNQLEVDTGDFLYVDPGDQNPRFGGHFAEDGSPIDTTGAGQLTEVLILNGNLPNN